MTRIYFSILQGINESEHDKTNKMTFAPSEDSDQTGQSDHCLRLALCPLLLHADSEDWLDLAGAYADLSLRWAHMTFC